MTSKILQLEGTWEEITTHASQLAGNRIRVTVITNETQSNSSKEPQNIRPASGNSLLRHAGTWEGEDFEDCLQSVYDNRGRLEF